MVKDFIQYTEALELKQLGFDEPCFGVYATKDGYVRKSAYDENGDAPTYSQAFRFFREKFKLQTYIDFYHSQSYFYKIKSQEGKVIGKTGDVILQGTPLFTRTYEEAELDCLKEMIKIVKNNYGKQ